MIVKHLKNNFEDERGIIRDITTHTPVDAITYITFKKNSVRGNHYHNKTVQYDYILEGTFLCRSRKGLDGKVEEAEVSAGDFITHEFPDHHAYKAITDGVMISCTLGPRQGDEFETDVVRLTGKDKLID